MGNGIIAVMNLVQMSLIYHKLEISDVGNWVFFLSTIGIIESVRNGFLATATIKFYAGTSGDRAKEVLGSVWFLALAITGLFVVVDLCFLPFLKVMPDEDLRITIRWVGITFISSLPYTLITWVLTAEERYDKILLLRMVNSGSMILAIAIQIFYSKLTLESMMWINFLTNMLTNIVGYVSGMAKMKTVFSRSKASIYEIFHFGKYSLGTNLVSNLLRNTDVFILRFLLGKEAVAIYNIPVKLMEIFEIPLRSFVGTGMSGMAIAYNNNNFQRIKVILTKYAGMLTMAFIPLIIFSNIVAELAVRVVGGYAYIHTPAVILFRIFIIWSIMYPIDRFNGATLDVIHRPKTNFHKVMLMLAVNIVADFIGILLLKNIYGVAVGSILTISTGLIFGYIELRKSIDYSFKDILVTGLVESRLFLKDKFSRKA